MTHSNRFPLTMLFTCSPLIFSLLLISRYLLSFCSFFDLTYPRASIIRSEKKKKLNRDSDTQHSFPTCRLQFLSVVLLCAFTVLCTGRLLILCLSNPDLDSSKPSSVFLETTYSAKGLLPINETDIIFQHLICQYPCTS